MWKSLWKTFGGDFLLFTLTSLGADGFDVS